MKLACEVRYDAVVCVLYLLISSRRQKTVKSTAELEVELNATYAFDAITEAGANLVPVTGPTLQGLQNLGNSCYMNSVVQLLLSGTVPELSNRYGGSENVKQHTLFDGQSPKDTMTDLLSQTAKLSLALTSGSFAVPEEALKDADQSYDPQYRLQPRMFKHVVAGNHVDFRTGQQQDAAQFLQYMLEQLDRAEQGGSQRFSKEKVHPTSHLFSFRTTTRLVCSTDQKIKYKDSASETMLSLPVPMEKATIVENEPEQKRHKGEESGKDDDKPVPTLPFSACLDAWSAETTVDDYRWPHLGNAVAVATSQTKLTNFPRYLLVQTQRYTLGADWTPKKLEVNLDIQDELDLTSFKAKGPQEGEDLVSEEEEGKSDNAPAAAAQAAQVDENALAQLMDMGFGFNGCKRALLAVGGSDVQSAMNWVFEHNQDPDFNDPVPDADASASKAASSTDGVDEGVVMSLVENLGCFTFDQVRAALKHTSGAADRAADWLFSHMDDIDSAVAALEADASKSAAPSSSGPAIPLDDGEGKYTMVGMVSHIGKHTGSGHYVAHLKRDNKWIIFNDEKVAVSATPPFAHAYLYLYQRTDSIGSPDPNY